MCEQEYLSKIERLDEETKQRFNEMFSIVYIEFRRLSYSKAELFLEHLKRTLKKDSVCLTQLWENDYEPTV